MVWGGCAEGVGELIRRAGLQMVELLMEEEVRYQVSATGRCRSGTANRWGAQNAGTASMGQKVPVDRPRVQLTEDREIRVGTRCSIAGSRWD